MQEINFQKFVKGGALLFIFGPSVQDAFNFQKIVKGVPLILFFGPSVPDAYFYPHHT